MILDLIGIGDTLIKNPWKQARKRARAARKKAKTKATGTTSTRLPDRVRSTRLGTETVTMTPGMRRMLPANQPKPKRARTKLPAGGGQQRGQTTAARPVRCAKCGGWYGALKSTPGRPRAHEDVRTKRPCAGGGIPPKARKSG